MAAPQPLELGQVIYIAVKPIFKIYMIIGVGFWLARRKILTVEVSKQVSAIAILVLIPCLAFQKIVSNIHNSDIAEIGSVAIVSVFVMGLGSLLCFLTGLLAGCPRNWWGGLICAGLLPNISDLPIAYLQTMQTSAPIFEDIDKGVSYVMIFMTFQMLTQFNFGAYKLIEMDFQYEEKHMLEKEDDLERAQSVHELMSTNGQNSLKSHETLRLSHSNSQNDTITSIDSAADDEDVESNIVPGMIELPKGRRESISQRILQPLSLVNSVPQHLLENQTVNNEPETINDIVRVYSRAEEIKQMSNKPPPIVRTNKYLPDTRNALGKLKQIPHFITSINYIQLVKTILIFWYQATMKVASITVIVSIIICMVPWLQALFVVTPQTSLPTAPDGAPPLSFIMDFAGYIGAAEVPFGLLLLGGTIGRLRITNLRKVWKVPMAIVISRLFISPVIGCAFNHKLFKDGLFYGEDILYFISNINFCLPPATSLIYITAFYTPVDDKPHIQMDFLAIVYIANYICLVFCLPFVTTYTIKVSLGF